MKKPRKTKGKQNKKRQKKGNKAQQEIRKLRVVAGRPWDDLRVPELEKDKGADLADPRWRILARIGYASIGLLLLIWAYAFVTKDTGMIWHILGVAERCVYCTIGSAGSARLLQYLLDKIGKLP